MLSIPHPCPLLNLQLPNSDILQHPQIDRNARLFVHQDILHQPTQIRPQSAAAFLAEPVRILPSAGEVSYQIFLFRCQRICVRRGLVETVACEARVSISQTNKQTNKHTIKPTKSAN